MHLKTSVLAAVLPLIGAYPITSNDVKCRSGPSTSDKIIKTYAKDADVKVTCQTYGELISGNAIWDKTSDNCYVSDYYVKTGSNDMVEDKCDDGSEPPKDGSEYNGKITRKEILARADFWISKHIPYSMEKTYPDANGRKYRTDCSGFVSMALHATSPGFSTVSLPEIAKAIDWDDLKEGDFVGTLGDGTGGADGHVTIFKSWANNDNSTFNTLECKGGDGCVAYKRDINFPVGAHKAKPFRYTRVEE